MRVTGKPRPPSCRAGVEARNAARPEPDGAIAQEAVMLAQRAGRDVTTGDHRALRRATAITAVGLTLALGLLGALVAIPLAVAVRVVVLRLVAPAVRRWSGANHDSKAASVPSNGARGAKSVAS